MQQTITRKVLDNGLTIMLKEIHTAPLISSWVWYRVGSRDEKPGLTGISHWVEHMQFKGTRQFPSGVIDKAISRQGGIWNAFTYLDWTTFYETMPSDEIDLAFRLEADRMVHSLFEPGEVASERTVIISEREGSENEPQFRLGEAVQSASFRVHPYQHEVIGDMADLHTIQRDDLYGHYRSFYHPGNAIVAVAGDFDPAAILPRLEELFGVITAGSPPPRLNLVEPPMEGDQRLTISGPGQTTFVQIAYRSPAASNPDFFACSVLDSLLTGPSSMNMFGGGHISNKTSRLYRAVVEKELAVSVNGGMQATIDPYLYDISMTLRPVTSPDAALAAVDAEIQRIQDEPVSQADLARAIKQARALFAYGSENITNQAFWMGYSEMFASYDWFTGFVDRLAAVTPGEVQAAARQYLHPSRRVVGIYEPQNGKEA